MTAPFTPSFSPLAASRWILAFAVAAASAFAAKFNIPAQQAPSAIQLFMKQAGAQVVYLYDDLKSVRANAVLGDMDATAAIDALLNGTGFTARQNEPGSFVVSAANAKPGSVDGSVRDLSGKPIYGATIIITGTGQSVKSDRQGFFVISAVPPGLLTLSIAAEGMQNTRVTDVEVKEARAYTLSPIILPTRVPGVVQLDDYVVSAKKNGGVVELDPYDVTGQRIKPFSDANVDLPRTIDDPKAYYIFSDTVIEQSGATHLEEFLNMRLPMNSNFSSGSKQTAGSMNVYTGTGGSLSMRGLGATQTLVLMNGRRLPAAMILAGEASPDLNSIPLGMIDRVEVLPSSASGIYGGSAVAGVINIITKRNFAGGDVKFTYDNSFSSDTAKRRVDLTYGTTLEGGRTHLMFFASASDGNFMTLGDRENLIRKNYARVAANNPAFFATSTNFLLGTTPRVDSQGNVPLVLKAQYGGQSLGSPFVFMPAGYRGALADGASGLLANAGKLDPQWPETNQSWNGLTTPIYNVPEMKSVRVQIRRQMLPFLETYFEFSYDQNSSVNTFGVFSGILGYNIPATSPTNPFNQTVAVRYPSELTIPYNAILRRRQLVGGFSLKLPNDWQAIADYSWNTSPTSTRYANVPTAPIITAATAGTVDLFADPRLHPQTLDRFLPAVYVNPEGSLREAALRAAGPLWKVLTLQPSLALGIQSRREQRETNFAYTKYEITPELNTVSGNLGASQAVSSYYSELTVPLVAREKARYGLRLLDLQLTGRRDEYSTGLLRVKGTSSTTFTTPTVPDTDEVKTDYISTNPTYGVRYKPVDDIMLRAAFAKGFLPPTALQLVPGIPSGTPSNVTDPRRGSSTASLIINPTGGNADLVPETSDNWSAGVVFTPKIIPGLRFAVDYTFIKKQNNIATLTSQVIVNNEALFPGRVTRGPVPANDPYGVGPITGIDGRVMNLYSTALEAYDFALAYQKTTASAGTFVFDALATFQQSYQQRITLGAPLLDYVGTPSAGGPLEFRGSFSLTWRYRQWQTGWSTSYYDSYKVSAAPFTASTTNVLNNGGPKVPSQNYHNVFVRYRFESMTGGYRAWRRFLDRTEVLVGVRNVFNKEPAFDGTNIGNFFQSPYGDMRLASYYVSLKRGF